MPFLTISVGSGLVLDKRQTDNRSLATLYMQLEESWDPDSCTAC